MHNQAIKILVIVYKFVADTRKENMNLKISRIEMPLSKIKLGTVADGNITLKEAKEAYKIRNKKVEFGISTGITDDYYKKTTCCMNSEVEGRIEPLIGAKQTARIHNHPGGDNMTFSHQDINGSLYKNEKSLVATKDNLFYFKDSNKRSILQKIHEEFNPVQSCINIINDFSEYKIKGFDKNINLNNEYKNIINSSSKLASAMVHATAAKNLTKQYGAVNLSKMAKDPENFKQTVSKERTAVIENLRKMDETSLDEMATEFGPEFCHTTLTNQAEKAGWSYKKHDWTEIFPTVLKSRGKNN